MLKVVFGVNMYEEDGFGFCLNISLRGMKVEWSECILIMEDGVLVVLVFYFVLVVYYFFNVVWMEVIEVLKGSS